MLPIMFWLTYDLAQSGLLWRLAEIPRAPPNVRFWHLADINAASQNVRFRG